MITNGLLLRQASVRLVVVHERYTLEERVQRFWNFSFSITIILVVLNTIPIFSINFIKKFVCISGLILIKTLVRPSDPAP